MQSNKIDTAIIIVNYNGEKYITDCVESLQLQTCKCFDIVIVDNASSDNSVSIIKEKYSKCVLLSMEENTGFSGGNNEGLRYAIENNYKYVMLLNEDTIVDENLVGVLHNLVNANTVVAPLMYMDKRRTKPWYDSGKIDYESGMTTNVIEGGVKYPYETTFITGCCFFCETALFQRIGMFDEDYYLYCEDTDLCIRFKKNGINMLVTDKTSLWHREQGKPKPYKEYYKVRNHLMLISKYADMFTMTPEKLTAYYIDYIDTNYDSIDSVLVRSMLQGIADYYKGIKGKRSNYRVNGEVDAKDERYARRSKQYELMNKLFVASYSDGLKEWCLKNSYKTIGIYGAHHLGHRLCDCFVEQGISVSFFIDRVEKKPYKGIDVIGIDEKRELPDAIVVTVIGDEETVVKTVEDRFLCKTIYIETLLEDVQ